MPDDITGIAMTENETSPGAARVGAGIRETRERLGWRLPDVAEALRIRIEYLTAIEDGDLATLPGPAYQTGFVRSYSQILGLDPDEILRRFRAEGALGELPKSEVAFLAAVPDRAVPKGAIVLLGVVIALGVYGLWFLHTESQRHLADEVPSVPAELAPLAVPPKPPVAPATPPAAPTATAPVTTPPAATTTTTTTAVAPAPTTPATATPAPTTPAATAAAAPTTPPGAALTITATGDTWVEVRDATGNILFSKVLHAGDSWPVPQEPGLTLTAGNAGGTEVSVDGQPGAPLGAAGVVLHSYALTPAATPAPAASGSK